MFFPLLTDYTNYINDCTICSMNISVFVQSQPYKSYEQTHNLNHDYTYIYIYIIYNVYIYIYIHTHYIHSIHNIGTNADNRLKPA